MRQTSLLGICFISLLAKSVFGEESQRPFERSPRALLEVAAAQPAPKDAAIEILSKETELVIGDDGRESTTFHLVYRVVDSNGAPESWKEVRASWTHWMTHRPEVRARVITPDGSEHWLDSRLIQEVPASEQESKYSDGRVLRGPLPVILDGSVVEVLTSKTSVPWGRSGTLDRFPLQAWFPARHIAVRVQVPRESPFHVQVTDGASVPQQRLEGPNRTAFVEAGPLEALKDDEPGSPTEFPAVPALWVSTGASWQQVAAEYSATVDRQLTDSDLVERSKQVVGTERDASRAANRILEWMRPLRYASVALGDSGMVPRTPDETLRRGFGDCKDLSTLVVGMLRAAGFQAWTALLQTGGADNLETMPGQGGFNHVIVRVGGAQPFWIDATAFAAYPAGTIPSMDQGRMALVASPETRGLVKLPLATPEANHKKIEVRAEFNAVGSGAIVERHIVEGTFVDAFRPIGPSGLAEQREQREKWFKNYYDAPGLTAFDIVPGELRKPAELKLRGEQVRRVWTTVTTARLLPDRERVLGLLPKVLTARYDATKSPPRKTPLEVEPQLVEVEYVLVPPRGFEPRPPAPSFDTALGPATFSRKETVDGDGTVRVLFRFRLEGNRLTGEQVDAFRRALAELRTRPEEPRVFDASVSLALERGQLRDALDESRALIGWEPSNPMHHIRLAQTLLEAGFGNSARAEAHNAVKLAPESPEAWVAVADANSHDALGRLFSPGWDRNGAILALRRSLELKFDGPVAAQLAQVLEYAPDGEHFGPGSELSEALAVYNTYAEHEKKHDLDAAQALAAVQARRCEVALPLVRELDAGIERYRLLLTCLALNKGALSAAEEATRLPEGPARQAEALEAAAQTLTDMREYALARALLQSAERFAPVGRSDALRKILAHAERAEERRDALPEATVRWAITLALTGSSPTGASASVSSTQTALLTTVREAFSPLYKELLDQPRPKLVALDLMLGLVALSPERRPNGGWRVRSTSIETWPTSEEWTLGPGKSPSVVAVSTQRADTAGALVAKSNLRTASDRAQKAGDLKRAQALRLKLVDSLEATAEDHLFIALCSLNLEDYGDVALDNATKAVWMTNRDNADALATLGLVYIGRGELSRGRALGLEAMMRRRDMQPGIQDWLVVRNVAIALGLEDEAAAAQAQFDELTQKKDATVAPIKPAELLRRLHPVMTRGVSR